MSNTQAVPDAGIPRRRTALGSRRVADAMHPGVLTCSFETPLPRVAEMMAQHRIHAVVVYLDGDEDPGDTTRFWGVVSDLDLVGAAVTERFPRTTAGSAAITPVVLVAVDEPLERAAQLMIENGLSHLIVVEAQSEVPLGVISTLDLARALAEPQ
jgi:CBS domain-containing protein